MIFPSDDTSWKEWGFFTTGKRGNLPKWPTMISFRTPMIRFHIEMEVVFLCIRSAFVLWMMGKPRCESKRQCLPLMSGKNAWNSARMARFYHSSVIRQRAKSLANLLGIVFPYKEWNQNDRIIGELVINVCGRVPNSNDNLTFYVLRPIR